MAPTDSSAATRALLDAARTLIESGESWSMSQLASAAGVSRTTLYRRFRSRQEVEQALRDAGLDSIAAPASVRERCLDAVATPATSVGLARMTIESVAEQAQVGVASVYRIFGSRKALLRAFTIERSPRAVLEALMPDEQAPLDAVLEVLVGALFEQVYEHAPWLGVAFSADDESRGLVAELVAVEREGRARLVEFMRRHVEEGALVGEPRVLAEALLSLAAGRALFLRVDGGRPAAGDAASLVRVFLDGARAAQE